MLAVTAGNTRNLPTTVEPAASKPFRRRKDAQNAAVHDIGEHAREGFEFTSFKCDGGWRWKATEVIPPLSQAQIKANGGKRSNLAQRVAEKVAAELADRAHGLPASDTVKEILAEPPPVTPAAALEIAPPLPPEEPSEPTIFVPVAADDTTKRLLATMKKVATGDGEWRAVDLELVRGKVGMGADAFKTHLTILQADGQFRRKGKNGGEVLATKVTVMASVEPRAQGLPVEAAKGGSKKELVGALLRRPEGCTTADILAATGWPAVSVPAQARAVGLGLRKEKDGGVTRYYGVPQK